MLFPKRIGLGFFCILSWNESPSVMYDSLWPNGLYNPWNSPGQNTGVGSLSLLQGIFLTQELYWGLLHCRRILYQLSYQGSQHPFLVAPKLHIVWKLKGPYCVTGSVCGKQEEGNRLPAALLTEDCSRQHSNYGKFLKLGTELWCCPLSASGQSSRPIASSDLVEEITVVTVESHLEFSQVLL